MIAKLQAVYLEVQAKKMRLDKITSDCRNLLKPWKQENIEDKQPLPDLSTPQNETVKGAHIDDAELNIVEKALSKAQNTRKKYQDKSSIQAKSVTTKQMSTKPAEGIQSAKSGVQNDLTKPSHISQTVKNPGSHVVISEKYLNKVTGKKTKTASNLYGQGQSKHAPAYTTAPFKTDMCPQRSAKHSRHVTGGKPCTPVQPNRIHSGRGSSVTQPQGKASILQEDAVVKLQTSRDRANQMTSLPKTQAATTHDSRCSDVSNRLQSMTLDVAPANENLDMKPTTPNPFQIHVDGAGMGLPGKYKKLYSLNHSLRDKASTVAITVQVGEGECRSTRFMQQLESLQQTSKAKDFCILKASTNLCYQYEQLQQKLHDICSTKLKGNISWHDVLKTKKRLENILSLFTDLEGDYQNLLQYGSSADSFQHHQQKSSPEWKKNQGHLELNILSLWLPSTFGKCPTLSEYVMYHSWQQLEVYSNLLHHVQQLLLQLHVLDGSSWLLDQLKRALEQDERSALSLYRDVYCLLVTGGLYSPALLHDTETNMDDTSNSDEDSDSF